MFWLLDSNILTRLPHGPDSLHSLIRHALGRLWAREDGFCCTSNVHGVTQLLTLNVPDFALCIGITAMHPQDM